MLNRKLKYHSLFTNLTSMFDFYNPLKMPENVWFSGGTEKEDRRETGYRSWKQAIYSALRTYWHCFSLQYFLFSKLFFMFVIVIYYHMLPYMSSHLNLSNSIFSILLMKSFLILHSVVIIWCLPTIVFWKSLWHDKQGLFYTGVYRDNFCLTKLLWILYLSFSKFPHTEQSQTILPVS